MISYNICTSADGRELAHLLAEVFTQRDPLAVATGLTLSEFEGFVQLFCPKVQVEGLTIVARSAETGEMVGALLVEDSASTLPEGFDRLSAKFDPIFDLLSQLDEKFRRGASPRADESLHLYLLGVAERFTGQGIAQRLVATCLENGARRGYRSAVTEATSRTSQHVFRKLGFIERVRGSYQDHRFGGDAVFASIAEHGGPILMEKSLIE